MRIASIARQHSYVWTLSCLVWALCPPNRGVAEIEYLNTYQHSQGASSVVNLNVNLFGLQNIPVSGLSLNGYGYADFNLNQSNSGFIDASDPLGFQLNFLNKNVNFAGLFLIGNVQVSGLKGRLEFGHTQVTNRNFVINSSSVGALSFTQGKITTTMTGGALFGTMTSLVGSNVVERDFSQQPLIFDFANLGPLVMSGTADNREIGLDNGPEINLPLRGVSTIPWLLGDASIPIPVETQLTGNIYLGGEILLPEFNSLALCSLGALGVGAYAAYRRLSSRSSEEKP